MRRQAIVRIRIITAIILVMAVVMLAKLYYLQVGKHQYFVDKAEAQYVHTSRDLFDRGSIYFTTKNGEQVSAASIQSGYVLAVNPQVLSDPAAVYEKISSYIALDRETFLTRATLPKRTYVAVDEHITDEESDAIQELKIQGLLLHRNHWRYYPGDDLSPRTVGFTAQSADSGTQEEGRYGIERFYEAVLTRAQEGPSVNFFAEVFSDLGALVFERDEKKEGNVVTSIEPTVSRFVQEELKKTDATYESTLTGAIVIDPHTGEIIALETVPNFNLNDRSGATIEDFKNPLVENVYEMGSIIKPLTVAAGLDSGAITPQTTYEDRGRIVVDKLPISNYDGVARGVVPMQEILNQSLNLGVSFIVERMGKDRFREYFKKLGLGEQTGIDLPNEAHGLVHNLESPRKVEYFTASFGQGIALTPIETVRALSALGNGGKLVTPHVATKIVYEDGSEEVLEYPEPVQVFSAETSETISRMLTTVVDEALRGGAVALPNHSIAAKTGTAQIANPNGGGYYADRYLHSFFGYFPSYDPQFLVFLYTVEPHGVKYASETLTEPFMNIAEFLLNYYQIAPDR